MTKPTMSIMRSTKELEFDVDLKHLTEVANIERDSEEWVTIYGTETDSGELFYIVINQALVDELKKI